MFFPELDRLLIKTSGQDIITCEKLLKERPDDKELKDYMEQCKDVIRERTESLAKYYRGDTKKYGL